MCRPLYFGCQCLSHFVYVLMDTAFVVMLPDAGGHTDRPVPPGFLEEFGQMISRIEKGLNELMNTFFNL